MGNKPWGNEKIIEQNDAYVVKLITYEPMKRTSLQYHQHKRETLFVVDGTVLLELEDEERSMPTGSFVTIEPGQVHRVTGGRVRGGRVLECQTPDGDQDIVRLQDDYGRPLGAG